jgi:hypothetical protein
MSWISLFKYLLKKTVTHGTEKWSWDSDSSFIGSGFFPEIRLHLGKDENDHHNLFESVIPYSLVIIKSEKSTFSYVTLHQS